MGKSRLDAPSSVCTALELFLLGTICEIKKRGYIRAKFAEPIPNHPWIKSTDIYYHQCDEQLQFPRSLRQFLLTLAHPT